MIKILKILAGIVLLAGGIFFLGPRPKFELVDPVMPELNLMLSEVEDFVINKDLNRTYLKENNQSRLIWADSMRQTEWSLVYLHGFSASPMEGHPTHEAIAKRFGMNLYIPLIHGHGLENRDSFAELTPSDMINSAKEALAVGKILGKKVLLMSCSTGGTYSIYLASHHPDLVDAMVMYSPNIQLYNPSARLLTGPWGKELGYQIGGQHRVIYEDESDVKGKYTTRTYRIEGVIALQALLNQTMKSEIFEQVKTPYFLGCYYESEEEQDFVVSVDAMRDFYEKSATPEAMKAFMPFPNTKNHVITSNIHSEDYQSVIEETAVYLTNVLGLAPKDP